MQNHRLPQIMHIHKRGREDTRIKRPKNTKSGIILQDISFYYDHENQLIYESSRQANTECLSVYWGHSVGSILT